MRKTLIIESLFLLIVGLISLAEGLLLISAVDLKETGFEFGPGSYVLLLSISLIAIGATNFMKNYKKETTSEKPGTGKKAFARVILIMGIIGVYAFLIPLSGYLLSTLIFFFLMFRTMSVTSWKANAFLTLVLSLAYYLLFVKYGDVAFPRGIFF